MQKISHYLYQYKEDVPQWLLNYREGMPIYFADIMSGRVGYYPGSYIDGHLVAISNQAHCVHSFLYVDYSLDTQGFRGYHSIGRIHWTWRDIVSSATCSFSLAKYNYRPVHTTHLVTKREIPYCLTEILERDGDRGDEWGAKRIACTFLFADGIAAYFYIFVQQYRKAPWIFLLQDHGFGQNYDRFGKGGLLDAIITKEHIWPKFVLCGADSDIWDGYTQVEGLLPTYGGMHNSKRHLFVRNIKQ